VYLSDPPSGDEEDVRTEDDYEYRVEEEGSESEYENAVEHGGTSGVSTPRHPDAASPTELDSLLETTSAPPTASVTSVPTDVSQGAPAAPRGLPGGLPTRPKGGLPGLPPRRGTTEQPLRTTDEGSSQRETTAEPSTEESQAPPTGASTTRPALPTLPPRPSPPVAAAPATTAVAAVTTAPAREEPPKVRKVRDQVQAYRTNIFRAALRLRYPTRSTMMQQLMYRLSMAERLHLQQDAGSSGADNEAAASRALADAERFEVLQNEPLDFSCTVLVLGLAGVGKTSTLHSLLGNEPLSGYHPTDSVQVLRGEISGIPVTFIDTPGLQPGPSALASNLGKLQAAKRAWNRHRPHAVMWLDRMDASRRDQADVPVMRAVSDVFGTDIWFSTVLTMTHATAPSPDGSNGQPIPPEVFQQQRSSQLQQATRQVTMDQRLMNPVALVDNSPACTRSSDGEPMLPNGTPWRRQLLMLCFTTKVLNEANNLLKPGDAGGRGGAARMMNPYMGMKVPPLGWLLSRLVDFRGPRKPPEDEREIKQDDELDAMPPAEKAAALRKKRMFLKQKAEEARADDSHVPIPAPEPQLGPSFDADTSSHHYRVLEEPGSLLVRPIVTEGGVDHVEGIDSLHLEKHAVLRPSGQYLGGVPFLVYSQVSKDKNQFAFQSQIEGSHFHSSKWASTAELNVQTVGRDVLFTQRLESRIRTGRRNKVTAGAIASKLGEDYSLPFKPGAVAFGAKLDDRLKITPNAKLRTSIGRVYTKAGASLDHGTAASADLKLRPGGDPTTRVLLGGSAVFQRRDTTYAGNVATEFRLPRASGHGGKSETIVSANASYNNKGNGQIAARINSHDYPQLALTMAVPILRVIWDRLLGKEDF
jgi:hypothetical protein